MTAPTITTTTIAVPFGDVFTLDAWIAVSDADPEHHYELYEGAITIMAPPIAGHQMLIMRIAAWLLANGWSPDLILAESGLAISNVTGRRPDLVVTWACLPPTGRYARPADVRLAVEIVSPSTKHTDEHVKPAEYAAAGVERLWVVTGAPDPDTALVTGYRAGEAEFVDLPLAEILAGAPGFYLPPAP